jgi:hypothetical protein
MTRVNDNKRRDAERAAAEKRTQKADQKSAQEKKDQFSKMMENQKATEKAETPKQTVLKKIVSKQKSKKQDSPRVIKKQAPRPQSKASKKPAVTRQAGQNALLARQGIASNRLAANLQAKGEQSVTFTQSEGTSRSEDSEETREVLNDTQSQVNREEQGAQDRIEAISRDDAEGGGGGMGGGQDSEGSESQDNPQAQIAAMNSADASAAPNAAAPSGPRLPDALVQELVKRVMVGADAEGISQFHIEFKDDVLGGVRLEISAEGGKINAKFVTDDVNVGRLLKASEGQLARAFGHKGMTLSRLEVEGP